MVHLISLPVAAHAELFRWQLDLFWFGHQRTYGMNAPAKAHGILINRNTAEAPKLERMEWNNNIPHTICESLFDTSDVMARLDKNLHLAVPLNIQIGLAQVLDRFDDDQMLEVCDCDMVHFKPCPVTNIYPNEIFVSTIYEDWHLKSRSDNRHIIARYFENGGQYYNGGFVPIIGLASTFRKLLPEWIAVHIDILNHDYELNQHWWAGMFALQVACEKNRIQMVAKDYCYVPLANEINEQHYIAHYCVDKIFDKRAYPHLDVSAFPDNAFYNLAKMWLKKSR